MNSEPFWVVWNPAAHSPTVKHATKSKALMEAKRLARGNPGQNFYVLEAAAHVVKNDCLVTMIGRHDDPDFHVPF